MSKEVLFPSGLYEGWLKKANENSKTTQLLLQESNETMEEVYAMFPEMREETDSSTPYHKAS
jgi:hypothetical protein